MTINCSIFAGFYYFFFNLNADIPIRLNPGSFRQRLKMLQVILNFVLKLTPLSNGRINWVYGVLRVSYVSCPYKGYQLWMGICWKGANNQAEQFFWGSVFVFRVWRSRWRRGKCAHTSRVDWRGFCAKILSGRVFCIKRSFFFVGIFFQLLFHMYVIVVWFLTPLKKIVHRSILES